MRVSACKTYLLQKQRMDLDIWLFVVYAIITSSKILLVLHHSAPQNIFTYIAIGT